ncbi:MAG: glycosyltransferase family 4 protein [Bacteroidetes bacterium]|nr:glycosyltransferase family 4 protein [Bacteroidota bacterium]
MRIGIEAQRIFRTKKHGMDIVVLELIKALQLTDTENLYYIFVKKGEDNRCLKETSNFKIVEVPGVSYADWEQVFLPWYAKKYKLDVLHCTSNTAPVLYSGTTVVTLHDVIFLEQSQQSSTMSWYQNLGRIYRKLIVPASIKKASHVITVSEYERKRISEILDIKSENISVVYNAFGKHFSAVKSAAHIDAVKRTYKLPENYIFYIGNTDPKKNIFNTIRAYRNYYISVADPLPLVIADINETFLQTVLEKTDTRSLRNNIVLTDYILNSDLPSIYAGASLFLYPSLRESFGIPVLESMASGTPVITSNNSALPEVAGAAAALVDANSEKNIGETMVQVLTEYGKATELVNKGYERIKDFSWSISADKLLTIYKAI